jgi:hypothetical protein
VVLWVTDVVEAMHIKALPPLIPTVQSVLQEEEKMKVLIL